MHSKVLDNAYIRRLPPVGSIQAFVAVARLGSIKGASESLALSSPALTRRIQALERFVGKTLFERHHNGIHLNPTGTRFFAEVAPQIDAMGSAVERITEGKLGMHLKIAVPSLFAAQRLVPALGSLKQRHPELQLDFDTGPRRLARLGDELDAAIVITDRVEAKFHARELHRGRVVRWRKAGVWDGLMEAISAACGSEIQMIDSTSIRAHQQAATAKRGSDHCLSRSRGGLTTKINVVVDAQGLPIRLGLTAGQAHDG